MSEKTKLLREEAEEEKTSSKRYGSVSYKYTLIDSVPRTHFTKKQCILVSTALLVVIIAFAVTLVLGLPKLREKRAQYLKGEFIVSDAEESVYRSSAIVVDGQPCAAIGKDILSRNGSVVDAAIASLFCDEVANPQSSGIGGGFFMIIYNRTTRTSEVIDARETAPSGLNSDLLRSNISLAQQDGVSVAVPGQLKGMIVAHERYGRLSWPSLVEPAIQLANNGVVVSQHLEEALVKWQNEILNEESLKEMFVNNNTGQLYKTGEVLRRPKLAQTLQQIANDPQSFYNGSIANDLIQDITSLGGIMTREDLDNYSVKVRSALNVSIHGGDYTLLTVPPPASGAVVALVLNILDSFNMTCSQEVDVNERILGFHRFIESQKFGFAQRLQLGDPDFVNNTAVIDDMTSQAFAQSVKQKIKERAQPKDYYGLKGHQINDEGTAHISIVGPNGDTVSVTSSINSMLGSKRISQSTGIVLNSEIKDFVIPAEGQTSPNELAAGKRPLSSMSPSIVIDSNGNPKAAIGGIGGTRIMSSVPQVLYQTLWKCYTLKEATDTSRLFYDLNTNNVLYESDFPKVYIDGLYHFGHQLEVDDAVSSVYTILETNSTLHTIVDPRKGGSSDGM